jgi:hypothetical protein
MRRGPRRLAARARATLAATDIMIGSQALGCFIGGTFISSSAASDALFLPEGRGVSPRFGGRVAATVSRLPPFDQARDPGSARFTPALSSPLSVAMRPRVCGALADERGSVDGDVGHAPHAGGEIRARRRHEVVFEMVIVRVIQNIHVWIETSSAPPRPKRARLTAHELHIHFGARPVSPHGSPQSPRGNRASAPEIPGIRFEYDCSRLCHAGHKNPVQQSHSFIAPHKWSPRPGWLLRSP